MASCETNLYILSVSVGTETGLALVTAPSEKSAFRILQNSGKWNAYPDRYRLLQSRNLGLSISIRPELLMESYVDAMIAYKAICDVFDRSLGPVREMAEQGASAYHIPEGGIPYSDLSIEIRTIFDEILHSLDLEYFTKDEIIELLLGKQNVLVPGVNIKTINNQSLIGSGDITISGGDPEAVLFTEQTLTQQQQTQARANIGAGTSDFSGAYNDLTGKPVVDQTPTSGSGNLVTSGGVYTALAGKGNAPFFATENTTVAELQAAIAANRPMWFLFGGPESNYSYFPYLGYNNGDGYTFISVDMESGGQMSVFCSDEGVWTTKWFEIENTDNKVTSLSSSSTDVQYPSAKAVYDALALKKEAYVIPIYQDSEDEGIYHVNSSVTYATMLVAANAGKLFFVGMDVEDAIGYVPATYVVENNIITVAAIYGALGAIVFITISADTENEPSVLFGSVSIPNSLSDLDDDTNHRLVTDDEKAAWNAKYQKPSTGIPASDIAAGVIPSAPGTLNTTATTAQATSSSEALSGNVTLHKVSKTGSYNDLNNKPTIPSAPGTLITNATTAQTASSGEAMTGNITLHKVSKTGSYSDLVGKPTVDSTPTSGSSNLVSSGGVHSALSEKQETLVSGTNIKTVNNNSLLGSGNITIEAEDGVGFEDVSSQQDGTVVITLTNGDTVTIDLNHTHEGLLPEVTSSDNDKIMKVVSGEWELVADSGGGSQDAVLYTSQSLTSVQQAQARTNIGAGTYSKPSGGIPGTDLASGVVPTTVASLTDASNYPKYVLLADEAAYTALATKDSGTLYLIPKTS